MKYGIILWGNSGYSKKIFILQKKVLRTITGLGNRVVFKDLNILTLTLQYIYSVVCFVVLNYDEFILVSEIHRIFTRQASNFYHPTSTLTVLQKGTFNMGIKIYSKLPPFMKNASGSSKTYKTLLKKFT
jgi:hypothetical protein